MVELGRAMVELGRAMVELGRAMVVSGRADFAIKLCIFNILIFFIN
jgi:hypothetical protein